jgi:hypothetical protein
VGVIFLLNFIPFSLSLVLLIGLILSVGLTVLFAIDGGLLFIHAAHEFSVPYGPIALFGVVTLLSSLPMMQKVGIRVLNLRVFIYILIILIAIFGSLVHRVFLIMWVLGLLIGFFIISKSFRQKSFFTFKRIAAVLGLVVLATGALELLSRVLNMSVISPLLRISRIEENALPSLTLVLKNTTLFGHVVGSSYWGSLDTGFASGYISLPISFINWLTLPYPLFYGVLVTKKDVIDYFLPGIFGYAFDFGYIALVAILIYCVGVIFIGFYMLHTYRKKREGGNRSFLGREAILIGALTAFIAQALVGLFLQNRAINGSSLVTFIFLGSLVVSHLFLVKRTVT